MTTEPMIVELLATMSDRLTPAGRRLAEFVTQNAKTVPNMTITAVARHVKVSEPTVARLCQQLGFSGFKEFRIALARQASGSVPYVHVDVDPRDRPHEVTLKVLDRSISTLMKLRAEIDHQALGASSIILAEARRIEFYGHGNSGLVAADAQHKFFRLGIPCFSYSDSHVHCMSAALLRPRDAVVCISRSGASRELAPTIEILKAKGVPVIGIMPSASPIGDLCDIVIHVDFDDDPNIYAPMSSRLGQLAIVDALAVSVAIMKGPSAIADLESVKAAVEPKKFRPA